jgi:ferrous iron transport protein B
MKIALLGNPNTGKSSVFNMLTGLRQNVGNFPGVTVDKKTGKLPSKTETYEIIDFPGTYSIYPRSKDEEVVYTSLSNPQNPNYPDVNIVVVDAANLERNLLLFTQIYDLQRPTIMVLNMVDLAKRRNKKINISALKAVFPEAEIVETNARVRIGKQRILDAISRVKNRTGHRFLSDSKIATIQDVPAQEEETEARFKKIASLTNLAIEEKQVESRSNKLDRILVHPVFGYLIFGAILIIIFQFIYAFAVIPMDLIDTGFASIAGWLREVMPGGILTDLVTQGIIPGIGGIVIFIPQIALLFFFIAILEETGYLSRVVFIMDRLMRPLGLNGKSIVPLLSSVACAIPGVMSARTISDWKERMITIMVAPLMSCSARIPVYTLLIALVIPSENVFGVFNVQGLVLFGLYALGTLSALLVALVFKWFLKSGEKGFLMLEMPSYKPPQWGNVGLVVWEKIKIFVWDAGKIILAISIILWVLATYGPGNKMELAANEVRENGIRQNLSESEIKIDVASAELENSFIGIMGRTIEPVIEPLGYDWKIGISLITSFAAREVFVGTMATIYAVQDDGNRNTPLIEKMRNAKRKNGAVVYSLAAGASLMVFYVYAMQCMSTLAVVKRETKSWKWPILQVVYMGVLAYLGAWITFMLLS